jgi:hypothetical protein
MRWQHQSEQCGRLARRVMAMADELGRELRSDAEVRKLADTAAIRVEATSRTCGGGAKFGPVGKSRLEKAAVGHGLCTILLCPRSLPMALAGLFVHGISPQHIQPRYFPYGNAEIIASGQGPQIRSEERREAFRLSVPVGSSSPIRASAAAMSSCSQRLSNSCRLAKSVADCASSKYRRARRW